ncbi:hypothetical protein PTNB73_05443 [Pyrenophora teres f. teres]|nr:hypothetical protein HRS9139_04988 [Pyrenophora teres f. teres]CAA9960842.1 hypothetical protein PTMSG1_04226 [Pyrenophora teres f. maculata]KAE8841063.1 hypothetical protein PTNB85_04462 [Pyrenophora teres f. teres]KAE8848799.1 hypothetical protein HRS9122_02815 [Pyrenophora teres f. teres]KAE8864559.1 hypothetical protein PTNB29_04523 [Pyrenophora teres f. teres]
MVRSFMQCASSFARCLTQIPCPSAQKVRPATFMVRQQTRCLHVTRPTLLQSRPPKSRDRGPKSDEDTQTDFGALDVLRNTVAPATSIDACTSDGFALNNQMRISGSGILLVGGEAFRWRPWLREGRKEGTIAEGGTGEDAMTGKLLNARGQWEVHEGAWGVLELVYPKPDILIIGTGPQTTPIAPAVRKYLNGLGIRLEIQDTRNASAQFNLLATERGVGQVAAALIPIGWREGR